MGLPPLSDRPMDGSGPIGGGRGSELSLVVEFF